MKKPRFALFITKAAYDYNHALSALEFCKAALDLNYTIEHVFFYASACGIANKLSHFNSDEYDVSKQWRLLAKHYQIPLKVCTTAAIRRGVASKDDALGFDNYHEEFEPVGMLDYFIALQQDNIVSVQF